VFKCDNLYLTFGPAPEKIVTEYPMVVSGVPNHAQQNADTLALDEEELRAEQLRMLMIEDPVEYERQLRDGELSDERRESELDE
jgi:hypothetical protein